MANGVHEIECQYWRDLDDGGPTITCTCGVWAAQGPINAPNNERAPDRVAELRKALETIAANSSDPEAVGVAGWALLQDQKYGPKDGADLPLGEKP